MASAETATLQGFLDAFNAHDVDAIMSFFTEDCVFDMPRGPAPGGRRLVGKQQVSEGDPVAVRRDPGRPLRGRPSLGLRGSRRVRVDDPRDAAHR